MIRVRGHRPPPVLAPLCLAAGLLGACTVHGTLATAQIPGIDFELVWDSDGSLTDGFTVEAGDADRDGKFDFAGARSSPGIIHLFETDGHGGYEEIWNSTAAVTPDSYIDFAFADTDGDSLGEIFGATGSSTGQVMLFEQSASGGFDFLHDLIEEGDESGNLLLRRVLVGDTDLDGLKEVIVLAGGANPPEGLVAIWEHAGAPGENTYARVYAYATHAHIVSGALGDSDHDGLPEVLLGLDGFSGFPLNIRRIEYDPNQGTWVHFQFTTSVTGLPMAPHVADLDQDGLEELAYGSSGKVVVFENSGDNAFQLRFLSSEPLSGDVLSLDSRTLRVPGTPTLAAGTSGGDLITWSYDPNRDLFSRTYREFGLGGPVVGLALADDGNDEFEELLMFVGGAIDEVRVYRRRVLLAVSPAEATEPAESTLAAAPNPLSTMTRLTAPAGAGVLTIHDVNGRAVRRLRLAGGSVIWDARDEAGRAMPRGIYWVRAAGAGRGEGAGEGQVQAESFPIAVVR